MRISNIFRTEEELLNYFLQACDLSNYLFKRYFEMNEEHSDKSRFYRVSMKAHKRFMRRSNALVSFQAIKSQELKAIFERMNNLEKSDPEYKSRFIQSDGLIKYRKHILRSNAFVNYKWREFESKTPRGKALSHRYFPLPAKFLLISNFYQIKIKSSNTGLKQ
jgi:hypothetical protein